MGSSFGIISQTGNNIQTEGLVFYVDPAYKKSYPGSGTTATNLINSNITGSLEGGATFESNNNGIFSFDGDGDYIEVTTTNISNTAELTVNCWVKTSDITASGDSYRTFFATGPWDSKWKLAVNYDTGKIEMESAGESKLLSRTALPTGEFVNVTYTYSSNTGKIYFNGNLSNSATYTLTHFMGKIYLGAGGSSDENLLTEGMWNGNIGPIQVYKRALSSPEVLQNYQAQNDRFI